MAKSEGQTIEKLFLELGLDLSVLQSDFIAAERKITDNLGRLNRERNTIKLRVAADIAGLDSVRDATKILAIQEQGLNQQLALSRDKLTILEAAYRQVANNQHSTAYAIQNAEQAWQKERIAVAQLEQQLKSLAAHKISLDTTHLQNSLAQIAAKIQHVRIKAEIDTSKLSGANAAFDAQKIHISAVTRELELQRQKLAQLQAAMYQSAKVNGGSSVQTLNIKSNVLQQVQEIQRLENKLKELQNTRVDLQVRADSLRQVESQVQDNIARLNGKIENVRLRADIDVSKLGAMATEFDKARAQVAALNQQLDLEKQKLAEIQKSVYSSTKVNGADSSKTIGLRNDLLKQIQQIDQLKTKIEELNKIQPPKTNNLLNGYLNIKGDVAGKLNSITSAFQGISAASKSADGALTKSLEIIGAIPHPAGKAVAALAAIPLVIKGIQNSLLELAKPAIASGDSFYVMSRGMQLSIADMTKLKTNANVAGIEINEVNSALRRFSMQMNKSSSENTLAIRTLERYGAKIYDNNGRIKNALGLAEELGNALKAAEAEGNGAAFRDIVGGKFWSGDFVTFLEDFNDNVKLAGEIVTSKLANPTWAHSIQGEINALNTQEGKLGGAFSAALMPVVAEIVPQMRKQFAELTTIIAANKENIRFLGDAMAVPLRMLHEFANGIISVSDAIDKAKDKETTLGKMFQSLGEYRDDVAALMNVAPTAALTAIFSPAKGATGLAIEAYRKEIDEFKKARAEAEEAAKVKNDERQKRMEESYGLSGLNEASLQKLEKLDEERIKREQDTADLIFKINHSSYENSLHDIERQKEEQLKIIAETEAELNKISGQKGDLDDARIAVEEEAAAKRLQIELDKEARLAEIRQRIAAADKTELENRMIEIEDEKDAWIAAGMQKAEAEKLAQQELSNYIKNIEQELSTEIQSLRQTDFDRRIEQIEREKQAWIDKGASVAQAEQLAQEKIRQERQKTEEKLNEIRDSVAALDRSDLENQLAAIEKEKNSWIQAGMEEAEANELAQQKAQKVFKDNEQARKEAAESYAKDLSKAYEDYYKRVQAAQEEAKRKNDALRNEALNTLKSEAKDFEIFLKEGYAGLQKKLYQDLIKGGVNPESLKAMTPEKLEQYKEAKEEATKSFLPNFKDTYSPEKVKFNPPKMPDILKEKPKSFDKTSVSADKAAKSLDRLADSADNAAQRNSGNWAIYDYDNAPEVGEAIGAYVNPNGSISIENMYPSGKKNKPLVSDNSYVIPQNEYKENYPDITAVTQSFSEMPTAINSAKESLGELPTAVAGVSENLAESMTPQIEQVTTPFSSMEPELQSVVQRFSEMNLGVQEVTVKLSDLQSAIENFSLQRDNSAPAAQPQPVNVNNSIQIDEAHAWDYEHIQELAERVAAIIQPVVVAAVGGDDNSY